jgi:hypothetical protein
MRNLRLLKKGSAPWSYLTTRQQKSCRFDDDDNDDFSIQT